MALRNDIDREEKHMPHPRAPLPPAELALLARLADELGNGLKRIAAEYVADARAAGATWREIGRAFGVTAQTAHQRFGSSRPLRQRRPLQ